MMKEPSISPVFREDLDNVLRHAAPAWDRLDGAQILITGGTGFFGRWLLETLAWAVSAGRLRVTAAVLTRDVASFEAQAPHLTAHPALKFVQGNIRSFSFGDVRRHLPAPTHIIHAATESNFSADADEGLEIIETAVAGTRRVLCFAAECGGSVRRLLYTSSGAVYGPQPPEMERVREDSGLSPDISNPASAYGESKRLAELQCICAARSGGYEAVIARGYAFVGPFLQLDRKFAAGNFLRDALAGTPIRIGGDGTPLRSYLYGADLAEWLWRMLTHGAAGRAYNLGADEACSIRELAEHIAAVAGQAGASGGKAVSPSIEIARQPVPGVLPARYVPDISRARAELDLFPRVDWREGCRRTFAWHRSMQ